MLTMYYKTKMNKEGNKQNTNNREENHCKTTFISMIIKPIYRHILQGGYDTILKIINLNVTTVVP